MSIINNAKHWIRDLFRYPKYHSADSSYDGYWAHRDMSGPLNSFQESRVKLALASIRPSQSVLDVGCGDGRIGSEIMLRSAVNVTGLDSSPRALEQAQRRGLQTIEGDIRNSETLTAVGQYDWVLLFEVLEHVLDSERLLAWAHEHARNGVIFSVPNTGFIMHRLRLLFGRFPLQWRAHPSEHLRFWTVRDMHVWLKFLGYHYQVQVYEGVPVLNRIFPTLFSAGMFVVTIE